MQLPVKKTLLLNMIVKNESKQIIRALESYAPHISAWVICDTGSTDNTKALIEEFFKTKGIPGIFANCTFENFSQARNIALACARQSPFPYDYILLADADMELRVKNPDWLDKVQGESFDMYQQTGVIKYQNRRLVRAGTEGCYLGVTHEFLNVPTGGCVPIEDAFLDDHCDGANRPDKFKRDIKLLKAGLEKEPKNERYMYYLAQSYRDARKPEKALKWYKKRVAAGGWEEEQWAAQQGAAYCCADMGDEAGYIHNQLLAYKMRPHRVEPLFDLAKYFREKPDAQRLSLLFSEAGMNIQPTGDALFVNDYAYTAGVKDEFSICAFYVPEKREKGFEIINELSLRPGPYQFSNALARSNIFHYHRALKEDCPSFTCTKLPEWSEDGWIAMNPSLCKHDGALFGTQRLVNYKINEHGQYLIRGTDGTANSSNPINTRTVLLTYNDDLTVCSREEIVPQHNFERKFDLVVGFEDLRICSWKGDLWASSVFREATPEGWCEQVSGRIEYGADHPPYYKDIVRMVNRERAHEKNWMPFPALSGDYLGFVYRLNEFVDRSGATRLKTEPTFDISAMAGGSPVIEYGDGYLCIIHEAWQWPDRPVRFYTHRFCYLNRDKVLEKVSRPFHLIDKGIEYVAGLAEHPTDFTKLVFTFGFKDCESYVASISKADVDSFLCRK